MALSKIRLELARCKQYPEGAHDIGYEFAAPLKDDGRIDAEGWLKDREHCRVRRFRPKEEDDIGHLLRKRGGSWAFHYDIHSDEEEDEAGYRFGDHVFKVGEYVSVREDDELIAYKVVRVIPVA
ncbi:MAG: hypothetical protein GYA66_12255 [Phyllobacteriaceae bacterium]|nr:hypothetical protein [Phyllobacteriaceae bacterium]